MRASEKVGRDTKSKLCCGGVMKGWIKVMTEVGMTRINMDAICAYQKSEGGGKLLVYTKDNSLFEIVEGIENTINKLDSEFGVN